MIYSEFCAGATLDIQSDCKFNDHLTNEISLIHSLSLALPFWRRLWLALSPFQSKRNSNHTSLSFLLRKLLVFFLLFVTAHLLFFNCNRICDEHITLTSIVYDQWWKKMRTRKKNTLFESTWICKCHWRKMLFPMRFGSTNWLNLLPKRLLYLFLFCCILLTLPAFSMCMCAWFVFVLSANNLCNFLCNVILCMICIFFLCVCVLQLEIKRSKRFKVCQLQKIIEKKCARSVWVAVQMQFDWQLGLEVSFCWEIFKTWIHAFATTVIKHSKHTAQRKRKNNNEKQQATKKRARIRSSIDSARDAAAERFSTCLCGVFMCKKWRLNCNFLWKNGSNHRRVSPWRRQSTGNFPFFFCSCSCFFSSSFVVVFALISIPFLFRYCFGFTQLFLLALLFSFRKQHRECWKSSGKTCRQICTITSAGHSPLCIHPNYSFNNFKSPIKHSLEELSKENTAHTNWIASIENISPRSGEDGAGKKPNKFIILLKNFST